MGISQIIALLSGVAMFMFGMSLMGDGLKRVSGSRLEPVLFKLSGTPVKGMLLGAGVTAVIQSSSATSVMVVGFVNSGMMKLRQAISVILGAILGTSITGWVICLSYIEGTEGLSSLISTSTLTGIIAIAGILIRMICKKQVYHHISDIMMGFAVLMFGMSTMSGAVSGLGKQAWFTDLLTAFSNPMMGILFGTLFAAVLQSASAAVGILQALSVTGMMPFSAALPLLMGVAIGASGPVLLSALGANTEGKRTAISYLVASVMGVMVSASIFYILDSILRFSFMDMTMDPFSIAMVNTLLRLFMVLLLAPFIDVLEALSGSMAREGKKAAEEGFELRLEERFVAHPALAIAQSRETINEMAREAERAVGFAADLLTAYSEKGFERVEKLETRGDHYEDALGSYLVKLTGKELTERQNREVSVYLHTLSDLERMTDHALNIAQSAKEKADKQAVFSPEAQAELEVISAAVREIMHLSVEAFLNGSMELASRVEPLEETIDQLGDEIKLRHVDRLQRGACTIANGFVINDLLTNFERVSDHCSNVAVALIELHSGVFDTHEYLGEVREKRSGEFQRYYEEYRSRFRLKQIPRPEAEPAAESV